MSCAWTISIVNGFLARACTTSFGCSFGADMHNRRNQTSASAITKHGRRTQQQVAEPDIPSTSGRLASLERHVACVRMATLVTELRRELASEICKIGRATNKTRHVIFACHRIFVNPFPYDADAKLLLRLLVDGRTT